MSRTLIFLLLGAAAFFYFNQNSTKQKQDKMLPAVPGEESASPARLSPEQKRQLLQNGATVLTPAQSLAKKQGKMNLTV